MTAPGLILLGWLAVVLVCAGRYLAGLGNGR